MVVKFETDNISAIEGSISFRGNSELDVNTIKYIEDYLTTLGEIENSPKVNKSPNEIEYKLVVSMNRWELNNKITDLSKNLCNYGVENIELLTIDDFLEYDNVINAFSTSLRRWKSGDFVTNKKALFSTNEDDYKFLTGEDLCKNSEIKDGVLKPEWIKIYDKFWNHWAEI